MITTSLLNNNPTMLTGKGDSSLGNILFRIASVIGIATNNGFSYGFPEWMHQEHFINPLPKIESPSSYRIHAMTNNVHGYGDIGFIGFNIPDNVNIHGYLGSPKYFNHCPDIIKHFLTPKPITNHLNIDFDECVIIHYRDYAGGGHTAWHQLAREYYKKALTFFPTKRVIVVTDNIVAAKNTIGLDCEYIKNSVIEDFYVLTQAKHLVMANSTFSWWGAYLSNAKTIAPRLWFKDNTINVKNIIPDVYLSEWTLI
jgi:hypothetical protein